MTVLRIDWTLGNICNFKCSYCHPNLYSGNSKFPDANQLETAFNSINSLSENFDSCILSLTGGEITNDLNLLDQFSKMNKNIKLKLKSNGFANYSEWLKIIEKLDWVDLTFHLHDNFNLFLEKAILLKKKSKVLIAITPEKWNYGLECFNNFKKEDLNVELQMLFKNYTRGNNIYLDYSEDQWKTYYTEKGINPYEKTEIESTIEFRKQRNLNDFYGHFCYAGKEQFVIDFKGDVFRGWCQVEGMGNIFSSTIKLFKMAKICPLHQCTNGFDLIARKSEGSWGMV